MTKRIEFQFRLIGVLLLVTLSLSCRSESQKIAEVSKPVEFFKDSLIVPTTVGSSADNNREQLSVNIRYPFLQEPHNLSATVQRIKPPEQFTRVELAEGSFAEWLRFLPLYPEGHKVHLYNGTLKSNQMIHEAVLKIDVGNRDLQQCADAVMRLRAEYLYSLGKFDEIHFNFTSGDRVGFEDWSKGRKPRVVGNKVIFTDFSIGVDTSYKNFRTYMNRIFNYAGTASLSKELQRVELSDIQAGDVFIQGGFPGHAVIVIDVAQNEEGLKCFLLAQSYMPAQEIHILKNPNDPNLSPWYTTDFGNDLMTPEWGFKASDLKRFVE